MHAAVPRSSSPRGGEERQRRRTRAALCLAKEAGIEDGAQVGGVLATNAGGVNVLRYGNARALCLGVEAVLPQGQIMHDLKPLAPLQHQVCV